jgi:hypothetical protein
MSAETETFSNYDLSAWQDRGLIVASVVKPIQIKKNKKRSVVNTLVVLSLFACGITYVHSEIPLTQVSVAWTKSASAEVNQLHYSDYVPPDYWAGLISRIQTWTQAKDVILPDFDSLAS